LLTAFRVDASLRIGTGHVMRCLTLADELRARGGACHFVCRTMKGDMIGAIRARDYPVTPLPAADGHGDMEGPAHAAWLETDWQADAHETIAALADLQPDWMVTDHYALDARWESAVRPFCGRMMALDDLADRTHDCDLLVDQTFGRDATAYADWTPPGCRLLAGAQYALLRPQFHQLRHTAPGRQGGEVQRILVSLGGVDPDNCTLAVLQALQLSHLPQDCRITVVMTDNSVWLEQVRDFASRAVRPIEVLCNVGDMADLMAQAELAVGAGGTTSWERCCLGLPTILIVVAENQRTIAENLSAAGVVTVIAREEIAVQLPAEVERLASNAQARLVMSHAAAAVTDGLGCAHVADAMREITERFRAAPARMGGHVA
jgi:UDP-2,4-diacetamido-2,4,6-trideoxy-beta-L-altropyranose hydrolase